MKRGHLRQRGARSWEAKFDVASASGKRTTRTVTIKADSLKAAEKELTKLLAAADAGTLADPSRATVKECVEGFIANSQGRSPKTLERYGELCRRQIVPHLGAIPMQRLKPGDVQDWHKALLTGARPLAWNTVHHAHALLSLALGNAVKNGLLSRNVALVHRPPRPETDETAEIAILAPEQIEAVLDALRGHVLHPIASLALDTGMRRGELLGLQWGDVDLDGAALRVARSLEETRAGIRLKPPKTAKGRRTITLPQRAVAMLRAHRLEQMQFRLQVGLERITDDTPVFCTVEGERIWPDDLTRIWARIIEARGLPDVTFHSLRHSHATMLIKSGMDIPTVSRRLGHSKPSTTLDVYSHVLEGSDGGAADAIDKILGKGEVR